MLYFVCFVFGILLFFDYFCNDFIVDLFTENKEIVIIIIITYFTSCSSVSVVNFEHEIAGWDKKIYRIRQRNGDIFKTFD